ncbi:hypothetical protein [Luteolibacter sp. Populi]|uniref:hypothetical protein n=1 Tax=Luteolibacter sp. Populi TaxID=3230487 RepID=UPI003466E757
MPVLVPLESTDLMQGRDPWSIGSMQDLVRVFLPEATIAGGAVLMSGVFAGRIYSRLILDCGPFVFPATYACILLLVLSSICIKAKAYPSALTRSRIRGTLCGSLLVFGIHLAAYLGAKATAAL